MRCVGLPPAGVDRTLAQKNPLYNLFRFTIFFEQSRLTFFDGQVYNFFRIKSELVAYALERIRTRIGIVPRRISKIRLPVMWTQGDILLH